MIGWAEKYRALLEEFDQADSVFDVRETVDDIPIAEAIQTHCEEYEKREATLETRLFVIQENDSPFESL